MAQTFDADAVRQGGPFQVNSYTTDTQYLPSVALNPSGEFVVTWSSATQDGSLDGVFGQRLCNPPPVAELMVAPAGGGAELHLTWTDHPDAADYEVLEDAVPSGSFATVTGTALSGASGLTTPMPAGVAYYFVGGRTPLCSPSP
jgi:hypothetical protein